MEFCLFVGVLHSLWMWIGCPALGVRFTGSLPTSRPKHGDHRYYVFQVNCTLLLNALVSLSLSLLFFFPQYVIAMSV